MYSTKTKQRSQSTYRNSAFIQSKLKIGASNDKYEKEADRMADQVIHATNQVSQKHQAGPLVQRKCTECEEEDLQMKPLASQISPLIQTKSKNVESISSGPLSQSIRSAKGNGQIMDSSTKQSMENSFGADFSTVNIHTGNDANRLSKKLNAKAFTVGNDIFFNKGEYQPKSSKGKHLLAHELTHTLQQGGGFASIQRVVETEHVSCGEYDADHPTMRVINNSDPTKYIDDAVVLAINYLDRTISSLEYFRSRIVDDGQEAGWPTIDDCTGTAINLRFRKYNASDNNFWSSTRGGVQKIINWYTTIRRLISDGRMRYTCITDYNFCGRDVWAGAAHGRRRIYFCLPFWSRSTQQDRALTIIHETSHIYFNTGDHNGRTMANAHCIEQFVADLQRISISPEFESACGGVNDTCS